MPTAMVVLNVVLITGVVVGILGLLAWGIVSDRPFATYLTNRAVARAQGIADRRRVADRRQVPRDVSGYGDLSAAHDGGAYHGPRRRALETGA